MENMEQNTVPNNQASQNFKFCKHCGQKIPEAAVVCQHCGCQVEELKSDTQNQSPIVINNTNTNANINTNINQNGNSGKAKNKWVAFLLCFFLGYLGAHKFYEGKTGMGILYLFSRNRHIRTRLKRRVFGALRLKVQSLTSRLCTANPSKTRSFQVAEFVSREMGRMQGKNAANPVGLASILTQQSRHLSETNRVRICRLRLRWDYSA